MYKRVFVSSTFTDLREFRRTVREAIRQLGMIDIAMENFGACDERPKDACTKLINEQTDIFIGIYAHRYGHIPKGDEFSITEIEYNAATIKGIQRLIYLIGEKTPRPPEDFEKGIGEKKLRKFKDKLKANHICGFFSSEYELAAKVAADLGRYLSSREAEQMSANTATQVKLINVPPLPPHAVPRPLELESLIEMVLVDEQKRVGIVTPTRVGIHCMGGMGKTVLAIMIANNEQIRKSFADGIYWLTLGQRPDILKFQRDLAHWLGGIENFSSTTRGKELLQGRLRDVRCLIILDDVWEEEHLNALDVIGSRGCMLVTTRVASTLTKTGAKEFLLEKMDKESALQLLSNWANVDKTALPQYAQEIIMECGYLPLALVICGAKVRDKMPWKTILSKLKQAVARSKTDPHFEIFAALDISFEVLQPDEQERYLQLAVFPKDSVVPEQAILTLWHVNSEDEKFDAQVLLGQFHRKALLTLCDSNEIREIYFHDLQQDYLLGRCTDLPSIHNRLLENYSNKCANRNEWHTGPNDGYFFQHLCYHLAEAGRNEELENLMLDPHWVRARLKASNIAGLISDYKMLKDNKSKHVDAAELYDKYAQLWVKDQVRVLIEELAVWMWIKGKDSVNHKSLSDYRILMEQVQSYFTGYTTNDMEQLFHDVCNCPFFDCDSEGKCCFIDESFFAFFVARKVFRSLSSLQNVDLELSKEILPDESSYFIAQFASKYFDKNINVLETLCLYALDKTRFLSWNAINVLVYVKEFQPATVVSYLLKLLSKEEKPGSGIAWLLGELGVRRDDVVTLLWKLLDGTLYPSAWWESAFALEKLGATADPIGALICKLPFRWTFGRGIRYLEKSVSAQKSIDQRAVVAVVKKFRKGGSSKIKARKAIREVLNDMENLSSDIGGRRSYYIVWLLGELRMESALPNLVSTAGHPQSSVRNMVAEAIGKIGDTKRKDKSIHIDEDVIAVLKKLLRDPYYRTRYHAAEAIGRINAKSLLSDLEKAFECERLRDVKSKMAETIELLRNS